MFACFSLCNGMCMLIVSNALFMYSATAIMRSVSLFCFNHVAIMLFIV